MEKLTKTQVSVLASYSSPFILVAAIGLNLALLRLGITTGFARLLVLSGAFPLGFWGGRLLYFKRSHVEILYDEKIFLVFKGHRKTLSGNWKSYKLVSIVLDHYGRADLRLYKALDEEFVELPISRTNANAQEFRNRVQELLGAYKTPLSNLRAAEVA